MQAVKAGHGWFWRMNHPRDMDGMYPTWETFTSQTPKVFLDFEWTQKLFHTIFIAIFNIGSICIPPGD